MRLALLALALLAAPQASANCRLPTQNLFGVEHKSWSAGTERLVVCEMDDGVFVVHAGRRGPRVILRSWETEWDYKAALPKVTFTIYTWRNAAEPRVPMLRLQSTLTTTGVKSKMYFVLRGKPFSETRFQQYLREFRDPATSSERLSELLFLMRDEGVTRPQRALELLHTLRPHVDGHLGEEHSGVISDLEFARDLPHAAP